MGIRKAEPLDADAIRLPTYVVDSVIRRDLGSGIASIINCRKINGVMVPQCEVIIAAHHLIPLGKAASDFAREVQRRLQLAPLHRLRMDGQSH